MKIPPVRTQGIVEVTVKALPLYVTPDTQLTVTEWETPSGETAVTLTIGEDVTLILGEVFDRDASIVATCDEILGVINDIRTRALARAAKAVTDKTREGSNG